MATAWLGRALPGTRSSSPAAWVGLSGSGPAARSSSSHRRRQRSRWSRASSTSSCASARSARARSLVIAGGRELGARALQARPQLRGELAPGRSRAPHEGAFCLQRLAALAAPLAVEPSVAAHGRALPRQTLADQELEGRPRAPRRLEHAVDLPLGEQRRRPGAAPRPSRRTSAAAPSARASSTPCSTRALELLLPTGTSNPASRSAFVSEPNVCQ